MKKIFIFIFLFAGIQATARELPMVFQSAFPEGSDAVHGFGQLSVGYGSSLIRPVGGTGYESGVTTGITFAGIMEVKAFYSHFFNNSMEPSAYAAGGEISATILKPHGHVPGLAFGVISLRDQYSDPSIIGRASLFFDLKSVYVLTTAYVEKAFGARRDPIDLVVSAAIGGHLNRVLRLTLEYSAQDLEDAWEADEAEGGMKQFLGLNLGWLAAKDIELAAGLGTDMSFKQPKPVARFLLRYNF